jgi:ABC-type bacteriocin/lantibiotic exporter with double-glycine peptidase domain
VWKVSLKLLLGILNGVGLVVVLVYGGWLVSNGQSDVGTVVAATIGLGRIQGPWKELVGFFRSLSVVQVQYSLLRDFMAFRGQASMR